MQVYFIVNNFRFLLDKKEKFEKTKLECKC